MAYPQDLKGKFLRYAMAQGITLKGAAHAASMVNGLLANQHSSKTSAVFDPPAPAAPGGWTGATPGTAAPRSPNLLGAQRGAPPAPAWSSARPTPTAANMAARTTPILGTQRQTSWSFNWLPYVAGAVTVCPIGGGALTGPMSGCYLFTFQHGGVAQFAHIGTYQQPGDQYSIDAKAAWITFNQTQAPTMVMGGSPAEYFSPDERGAASFAPANPSMMPIVFGFATPNGAIWSLLAAPVPLDKAPITGAKDFFKIVDVRQMRLQPWSTIAALRTFQLHGATEDRIMTGVIKGSALR